MTQPPRKEPTKPDQPPLPELSAAAAWANVMQDVGPIAKSDRNNDQHFNFRGVDAVMNTVGPVLRAHRVFVLPRKVEKVTDERYVTKSGAHMHNVMLTITWNIYGPLGDYLIAESTGEAADSGDKAASKAHSVAYRTLFLQALCVPTGDPDPDSESHERADGGQQASQGRGAPPADPRQAMWNDILNRGKERGLSVAEIRDDYKTRHGHEIDGPEATPAELTGYFHGMATPPAENTPTGGVRA